MSSAIMEALKLDPEYKRITELPKDYKKCFKFAILREPIDRFISGYVQICPREKPWSELNWKIQKTLSQFIRIREKENFNYHLDRQTDFLPCDMDYYVIMEKVNWSIVQEKTGLVWPEKTNAKDPALKDEIRKLLTPEMIRRIKKIYQKDIDLYELCLTQTSQTNQ